MPDRLDWDDARRRDQVRKNGGVPAWSDMGSDVVPKTPASAPASPTTQARQLIVTFSEAEPLTRRANYGDALRQLDTIYSRARQRLRDLPADRRDRYRQVWENEQFQMRGELLRLAGLTPVEARELIRAQNQASQRPEA